jgi:hypothetical protein
LLSEREKIRVSRFSKGIPIVHGENFFFNPSEIRLSIAFNYSKNVVLRGIISGNTLETLTFRPFYTTTNRLDYNFPQNVLIESWINNKPITSPLFVQMYKANKDDTLTLFKIRLSKLQKLPGTQKKLEKLIIERPPEPENQISYDSDDEDDMADMFADLEVDENAFDTLAQFDSEERDYGFIEKNEDREEGELTVLDKAEFDDLAASISAVKEASSSFFAQSTSFWDRFIKDIEDSIAKALGQKNRVRLETLYSVPDEMKKYKFIYDLLMSLGFPQSYIDNEDEDVDFLLNA